jgi:Na+/H+-dicarboxylate symporter
VRVFGGLSRFTLGWRLLAALVLGIAVGIAAGPRSAVLRPLGGLLLALLESLAVPAVVAFVLAGVSGVALRRMGVLGARLVAAFALLSLGATVVGAACAVLIIGTTVAPRVPQSGPPDPLAPPVLLHGWWRPTALTVEHAIPAALVAALLFGLAVAAWRERDPDGPGAKLHAAFRRLADLVTRALGLVLVYAPVGVFALVATTVGSAGGGGARGLASALLAVYLAQAVVSTALVAFAASRGERPRPFLAAIRDALVTALATGSSAASLPVETRSAVLGLRREPASAAFALSLGNALSKAGTATFLGALGAAALVLAGQPAGVVQLLPVVLAATVAALATPPVAGGGFVMLGFVAQQAGLPLDLVALLLGVPFVGKANTPVNALGRLACVAALVPRSGWDEGRALDGRPPRLASSG